MTDIMCERDFLATPRHTSTEGVCPACTQHCGYMVACSLVVTAA